jgi:hypothetical protein
MRGSWAKHGFQIFSFVTGSDYALIGACRDPNCFDRSIYTAWPCAANIHALTRLYPKARRAIAGYMVLNVYFVAAVTGDGMFSMWFALAEAVETRS